MPVMLREPALGLFAGLALLAGAAGPAGAAPVDARVSGTFVMHGVIVTAVRVTGERRGQAVTRRWSFRGRHCTGEVCQQLALRRQRSAHRVDSVVLSRTGVGSYTGTGRFFAGLRCRGRTSRRGVEVPYRVTVQIAAQQPVQGIPFANQLTAAYANPRRIDRTRCPIGPSHDAALYTGTVTALPAPPAAAFGVSVPSGSDTATFADTSEPVPGGARIVFRQWQFGDPASGPADSAQTPTATHAFSASGTYTVMLTVTDARGLTATSQRSVTVPGPTRPRSSPAVLSRRS
jgi:hypothetical protein